jgi:hypothetical protein
MAAPYAIPTALLIWTSSLSYNYLIQNTLPALQHFVNQCTPPNKFIITDYDLKQNAMPPVAD